MMFCNPPEVVTFLTHRASDEAVAPDIKTLPSALTIKSLIEILSFMMSLDAPLWYFRRICFPAESDPQ
jgi:hypothetical protein